ncbi:MAG TPA: HU family DNA-binding protein [Acidimicrobiales bacterium]|nr:HU family DNA-binding protein [Acidimicrobiales bacterium]
MNRRDLVKVVAAHGDLDAKQVDATLRNLTDVITAVVAKGEPVTISGFAKFAKIDRQARMGRNPATGESIKIKASKKARITPLKGFKDAVMKPSQAPKLARGVWSPSASGGAEGGDSSKASAKKAPAKKSAPAKATAKKAAVKKAPAKKATAKKAAVKRS